MRSRLDVTNHLAFLTLHNTRSNYYYQLLSKAELNPPWWWNFGQVILNTTGTNQLYFNPVSAIGQPIQFYRGVEGFPVVSVKQRLHESLCGAGCGNECRRRQCSGGGQFYPLA